MIETSTPSAGSTWTQHCPAVSLAAARRHLSTDGFVHLLPFLTVPSGLAESEVAAFVATWDDLPPDPYGDLAAGAGRRRRYGRFCFYKDALVPLPHAAFLQARDHNPVFGGLERWFSPLDTMVAASPSLAALVRLVLSCCPGGLTSGDGILCGVHQIRVQTTVDAVGKPSPEGRHRDGHDFVAQILIHRHSVRGGLSSLYTADRLIYSTRLRRPFEGLLIDDRRFTHTVSTIRPENFSPGHRDMLLIDISNDQELPVGPTPTG